MATRLSGNTDLSQNGVYYLQSDHLGSTLRVLRVDDAGNVQRVSELRYLPWGEERPTDLAVGVETTEYRYTGQRVEDATGLYWYNSRWYDPALGRWIQPDSIIPEAAQGVQAWDRFAYVNNNPIRYNDPSGHCLILCTALLGGAIGAIVGAVTYTATNAHSFDTGEMLVTAGGGAVAGALIGSGVGLLTGGAAGALATTATIMTGAGSGAAGSGAGYMLTNIGGFEENSFLETTAIGGVVGGISAPLPVSSIGTIGKGLTYIAGSETQYALQTDEWTVEGAQQAAIYGAVGAGFDLFASYPFTTGSQNVLSSATSSSFSNGYALQPGTQSVLNIAAHQRGSDALYVSAVNSIYGISAGITTGTLQNKLLREKVAR